MHKHAMLISQPVLSSYQFLILQLYQSVLLSSAKFTSLCSQAHPGKICLFVSSEITSSAFYCGERKEALVTNALFRMGGSAAILTSNPAWRHKSKYQLTHCVRVHTGASDRAFK